VARSEELRAAADLGRQARRERTSRRRALEVRGAEDTMAKTSPAEFIQQVRNEAAKVTWPSRKEAMVTTAMVFVMVVLASVFFLVVDQVLRFVVRFLLGMGG
jgi:preprotein translocase subunit SecE